MTTTSILWYFAVFCILRGNSETIPEIAYEIQDLENEVLLLPLNNVPVKRNQTAKYDTFVLMEESEAKIALYGKTIYTLLEISVDVISENWRLKLDQVFYAKENSHKYVYVKINPIYSYMRGKWEITFRFGGYKDISKTITVHIRPSKVSNVPSVFAKPNNLITTQIASYTIEDFDAFGCLVYKDQDDLAMRCKPSTSKTNLMEWSPKEHCNTTSGKEAAYYNNRLKLIHDGSYMDCIEHMIRDTITVRIFLVLSSSKSWPNNNSVKSIPGSDRDDCANYVNCLYNPEVLKQNDYCVKPTHTEPDSENKIIFQIAKTENNLLSVNGRYDNSTKRDTFTIFEGEPAIIDIYYNSSDISVEKVTISEANTNGKIITKEIKEEIDNLYTLKIKSDCSKLTRIWKIQIFTRLVPNDKDLSKINTFQIHIRPNEDGMPRVHTRNKIIPIQRANSSFQEFDGFGCVLYDSNSSLDLYCRKSRTHSTGINWKAGTETNFNDNCGNRDYCMVSLNLPQTGTTHMDCTEQLSEDITTVRIFFIHNNNDINIPSSEKDRAGCLNYVTGYYSPDNSNLFHDFKNKTAWPALGPKSDTARQSKTTTVVPDITSPPLPPSDYTLVIVSVLTILVVILILTILYMKCKFKKYWTSNMPTEPRYANDKSEFNNDRQPLRENVENNIYVDSDSGTVQYMNNIPDIYAKPVPKSERNVQVNHERAETNVLVDNSVYEGSDIYAEPNYDAIGKQSNTGTPCNEEYSYAYADASCIRPLANNTCDKTYDYATINEKGQDTYAEVQKNAKYSNINTNNTNGVSKDYVNDTSYLNTKQKGSVDTYANTSDRYYANRSEF